MYLFSKGFFFDTEESTFLVKGVFFDTEESTFSVKGEVSYILFLSTLGPALGQMVLVKDVQTSSPSLI